MASDRKPDLPRNPRSAHPSAAPTRTKSSSVDAGRQRGGAKVDVDAFDRAILAILQADNRTPQREIGERVNLSAPAVQRRITRMERGGIIRANATQVDPDALGQGMTVIVEVTLASDHYDIVQEMKQLYRAAPEVQQCYCTAGESGFILVILCASLRDYEDKTFHLLGGNPQVKVYRTLVVLDRVKTTLDVPV